MEVLPKHERGFAWWRGLRERFLAFAKPRVAEVTDEFPFALYVRLYSDAVMDDFSEVSEAAWIGAIVIHAAELLFARYS